MDEISKKGANVEIGNVKTSKREKRKKERKQADINCELVHHVIFFMFLRLIKGCMSVIWENKSGS